MAQDQPERAAGVPAAGVWSPHLEKWQVCARDDQGAWVGECLRYRADGTLFSRSRYIAGRQEGPFTVFHRDGQLAREGTFVADMLDGPVTHYTGTGPGSDPLRACCVPPNAVRMQVRYRAGEFIDELFYDAHGKALQSDGTPWPPRPATVPEEASYDETTKGWAVRTPNRERLWDAAGAPTAENDFTGPGIRSATRTFDAAGAVVEAQEVDAEGRRHGEYFRHFAADAPPHYTDARIRAERGRYEHGQPVGRWSLLAADGSTLRTVDRGAAFADEAVATSPAFAETTADGGAAGWWALARELRAAGRVREALVAAARAAVGAGDRAAFVAFRSELVEALAPAVEAQWGDLLVQTADATVAAVLDGLVGGADAAAALRSLAGVTPGQTVVALELVEASLLLAPDRRLTHMTRALLRFQRGDEAGTLADAEAIAGEIPEVAASLRDYVRAVFRPYDFVPPGEPLIVDEDLAGVAAEIAQGPEALRRVAGVYATRLRRLRVAVTALLAPGASPRWLPPDLGALLPDGDVPLRRERITCDLEPGAEGPPEQIELDEEVAIGAGVPALVAAAHADFAALAWLCWATGLDQVALPTTIAARPELAAAMRLVVTRCWRAQDRVSTGGLVARAREVPGFDWQGTDIDDLPTYLAEMAAAEYLAVRSMFLWLASPDTLSPFQDDIRDA
jgi:hypothetical protein